MRADPARVPQVAQTKLVTGLISGVAVVAVASLVTFPLLPFLNVPVLLAFMWLTLRFLEDLTSSLRAALALARLLFVGKRQLLLLREMRDDLRQRVERLAVERAGLPRDAGVFVSERERRWTRLGLSALPGSSFLDRFAFDVGFFDVRRRRKKGESLPACERPLEYRSLTSFTSSGADWNEGAHSSRTPT